MSKKGKTIEYEKYTFELNNETDIYKIIFIGLNDFYIPKEEVDIQFSQIEKEHLLLINKNCVYRDKNNKYYARNITINKNGKVVISKESLKVINEYEAFFEVADTDKEGKTYLYY